MRRRLSGMTALVMAALIGCLLIAGCGGGSGKLSPVGAVLAKGSLADTPTIAARPASGVLPAAAGDPPGVIKAHGTELTLDGKPFTFAGVDAYELGTWWGQDVGCGANFSQASLDQFFSALPANSVVRTWAWQGSVGTSPQTGQRNWAPLDRLVSTAAAHGVRLILSLGDQDGTCDDGQWHGPAWYSGGYRQLIPAAKPDLVAASYWTWVQQVVTRYRSSPAIGMWEPINEAEASTCTVNDPGTSCYGHNLCVDEQVAAKALRSFFDAIGTEIHQLDPAHLVESGLIDSGQCGLSGPDAAFVNASPGIDVTDAHDYGADGQVLPGDSYNGERLHLSQSLTLGKPMIVGETGTKASVSGQGCVTPAKRATELASKIQGDLFAGVSGVLVWDWVPQQQSGCSYDVGPADPLLSWLRQLGPDPL